VLDPLTGYIKVIEKLLSGYELKTVNFGPVGKSLSVQEVIKVTSKEIDFDYRIEKIEDRYESKSLELNSNYAYKVLNWLPVYNQEEAILKTVEWWQNAIRKDMKVIELCRDEIKDFIDRLTRLDTRK
jgi:nucleoside-diphosphate-sugar epimerase